MCRLERHGVDWHRQLHRALYHVRALILDGPGLPEEPDRALGLRGPRSGTRCVAAAHCAHRAERDARVLAAQMLLGNCIVIFLSHTLPAVLRALEQRNR